MNELLDLVELDYDDTGQTLQRERITVWLSLLGTSCAAAVERVDLVRSAVDGRRWE